jgi:hypothetical protein
MDDAQLYEIVMDAVTAALEKTQGGDEVRILRRFVGGEVAFRDGEGKLVRAVPVEAVFKKVTAVREKLRVLEQKLNNHPALDDADRAELQGLVTRAYGSLTTFNFLFRDEGDKFKGMGGE